MEIRNLKDQGLLGNTAIEVNSHFIYQLQARRFIKFSGDHNIPMVGGSDAHKSEIKQGWGRYNGHASLTTHFESQKGDVFEDLKTALAERRTTVVDSSRGVVYQKNN